jgi:predicted Rossmann-fold nucleotide-binding protein
MRVKIWRDRLFELIDRGDGYAVCAGGTDTLVELAVVWEMMNKSVMAQKPVIVLGGFWKSVIDRVREAESDPESPWIERQSTFIEFAGHLLRPPIFSPPISNRTHADFPEQQGYNPL